MIINFFYRQFFAILLISYLSFQLFAQPATPNASRVRNYDVQHYTIRISFDRTNKTIFGDTTVQLKPLQSNLKSVALDAANLAFETVQLADGQNAEFKIEGEKIYVTLDKNYTPADVISIRFRYSAKPIKGVYFVERDAAKNDNDNLSQIWTQGEPEEAHHWFPSYDFPDDKATSEQFITVEKNETAIGNGEPMGVADNADGTKTFHYKMPVPHSTYLTSFVVGTYKKFSDSYKNIPLNFYTYPDKEAIALRTNIQTKEMMKVFEELTGIDYPYNKYDQTVVAKFDFGGMENITATTMADTEMFFNRPNDVEDLVSHELAHSWFGNMVTCKNWSELWLNEGFATFLEAAYREQKYGRKDYLRKLRSDLNAFRADEAVNQNRHGLFNVLARPDKNLFDVTTYQKGGLVIHTLRETVGTENFWKAVNIYLSRHKFQNVETADLQKAMEEVSKTNLDWFFRQWVYGAGYPKLQIEQFYNERKKTLELNIKQTQAIDKITPEAFVLPVEIEITLKGGAKKSEKIEIKKREQTFSIKLNVKPEKTLFDKDEKIPLAMIKTESIKKSRTEN